MAEFHLAGKRIFIAGETGMVGSAIKRVLYGKSCEILSAPRANLDLTNQAAVKEWFTAHKPDAVIMAAGRVGGIEANRAAPADFLHDNLTMATNVIKAAHESGVQKLLYLGSSCMYPRECPQPMRPEHLLSSPLEPTNEGYALAKLAGIKLCHTFRAQYGCDFISAIPCNLYGPNDHYDAINSHVIPALIMKAHAAKDSFPVWGDGSAMREFLHVDDLAAALIILLENYSDNAPINIGSGTEISIKDLTSEICRAVGTGAAPHFDETAPEGVKRKLMDSAKMREMGWAPRISLQEGLAGTYQDYLQRMGHFGESRNQVL